MGKRIRFFDALPLQISPGGDTMETALFVGFVRYHHYEREVQLEIWMGPSGKPFAVDSEVLGENDVVTSPYTGEPVLCPYHQIQDAKRGNYLVARG